MKLYMKLQVMLYIFGKKDNLIPNPFHIIFGSSVL